MSYLLLKQHIMVIGVDLRVGIIKPPSHFTWFGNGSPDINKTNESYPSLRDCTNSLLGIGDYSTKHEIQPREIKKQVIL
jgi:hypothetical protein